MKKLIEIVSKCASGGSLRRLQVVLLAGAAAALSVPLGAQVPAALFSTSSGTLAHVSSTFGSTDTSGTLGRVSVNSRGDVFYLDTPGTNIKNFLVEIPVGTTTPVLVMSNVAGYSYGVYVDPQNNLWVADGSGKPEFIPFVNGTYSTGIDASTLSATQCTNPVLANTKPCYYRISTPTLGYYAQANDFALDGAGNVYIVDRNDGITGGAHKRIVQFNPAGVTTILVDNLAPTTSYSQIAVTAGGDIYYVDGTSATVQFYPAGSAVASTIGVGLVRPTGVSIDAGGSLYITDTGAGKIVVIPNAGGTLSSAYQYSIAAVPAAYDVGVDSLGNIYYGGNNNGQLLNRLSVNRASLGSVNVGASAAAQTLNLLFNTATTFGSFVPFASGTSAGFTVGATTCVAGRLYAVGSSCTVAVGYTATAAGPQGGALSAYDSSSNLLAQVNLSGFGQGPLGNVDPGTNSSIGTSWKNPVGIALDGAGNNYVLDSSTGSIVKNGQAAPVVTGLAAASAIAADGAGNLYVATNNNVVKFPLTGTAYGSPLTLLTGLSGPAGLALDTAGHLYVADSGHNRVLQLAPSAAQALGGLITSVGSGFAAPSALATDNRGNIFIADSGSNRVYQVTLSTGNQTTLLIGLTNASGLAVDAGGSLFVADSGKQTITRLPAIAGVLSVAQATTLGSIVATPSALAADPSGNIYATDVTAGRVAVMTRSSGNLNFGSVIAGQTSSPLTATLSNAGTIPLQLGTPFYNAPAGTGGFSVQQSTTCVDGATLAPASTCNITAVFKPSASGAQTASLAISTNGPATTVGLQGLGVAQPLATISGSTSLVYGTTPSYTVASMVDGTYTIAITGTMTATASVSVTGGTGAFSLPLLNVGAYTLSITVNGTVGNLAVVVTKAPLTVTASNATRAFGLPNPAFTGMVSGAVNGDQFVVGGSSIAGASSPVGSYFIIPSVTGTALANYTVTAVNGTLTVTQSVPSVSLTASTYSVPTAGSVAFTAIVSSPTATAPTGNVQFYSGTSLLGTVQLAGGSASFGYLAPPNGLYSISAIYVGDVNFSKSTSPAIAVSVGPPGFTFAVSPLGLTIKQGQTGTATLTLTPYGGFNQPVVFSCAGLPAGASCSFTPSSVTPSGAVITSQVTIATAGASAALSTSPMPWQKTGNTILWAMLLTGMLARRRKALSRGLGSLLLLLVLAVSGTLGCGSNSSALAPTPVGQYTATVMAYSSTSVQQQSGVVSITITQ